jgi:hypothetical protein
MNAPDMSRAVWRKSRHSAHDGGNCVEVATVDGMIAVRDSKNPAQPTLVLAASTWKTFTSRIKSN